MERSPENQPPWVLKLNAACKAGYYKIETEATSTKISDLFDPYPYRFTFETKINSTPANSQPYQDLMSLPLRMWLGYLDIARESYLRFWGF